MEINSYFLGIDLGTSGVRIALIDENSNLIHTSSLNYPKGLKYYKDWIECIHKLILEVPQKLKQKVRAIAVDGTSGTLIACKENGSPIGNAIAYNESCLEVENKFTLTCKNSFLKTNNYNSLNKAFFLTSNYGNNILLRHQADWINGWLLNNWTWGDEGNNLKLGWDLINNCWPKEFINFPWFSALPKVVKSGSLLGKIYIGRAKSLSLPKEVFIIAGTTDSNASVLAANATKEEAITILGSTIVLKIFVSNPIFASGLTNHKVGEKWLCGGSSNAGGAVLKEFFTPDEIESLSLQINPNSDSGLSYIPLLEKGERFPTDDPLLKPILEPRPISDALYLQGLLEGLVKIEALGWEKMKEVGIPPPKKLVTIGGGAKNPTWKRIRERYLQIPIRTSSNPAALGVAKIAAKSMRR